jgi:hypothetical protein
MANNNYDVVIIGAGIIGAAIGYELAKKGRRTLNVEMLPAAGYGSTSNSCAIIRLYYSTLDGCAMAYDGYHYWKEWAHYLQAPADEPLASFNDGPTNRSSSVSLFMTFPILRPPSRSVILISASPAVAKLTAPSCFQKAATLRIRNSQPGISSSPPSERAVHFALTAA